jgi:hypothetical protein
MTRFAAPAPGIRSQKSIAIACFTAMAVLLGATSALVSTLPASDPVWKAPSEFEHSRLARNSASNLAQAFELPGAAGLDRGEFEASRLVWCMMPRAWQRDCEAAPIITAAN